MEDSTNLYHCRECDTRIPSNLMYDGNLCSECNRQIRRGPILGYRAEYRLNKFGTPKDGLFYGIELEVDNAERKWPAAKKVLDLLGKDFAVCMYDGSLSDYGFEIISAPAVIEEHYKRWPAMLKARPENIRSWETSTCGMHVHVSREPLTDLTIGKVVVFVNSEHNNHFIQRIAGRDSTRYARREEKGIMDAVNYREDHDERYTAVNLQNENTIEFRIFKGTLNQVTFFKNIEFCAALIAFCKQSSINPKYLVYKEFCGYVDRHRKVYPNLLYWLREKGYLTKPTPPKPEFATPLANAYVEGDKGRCGSQPNPAADVAGIIADRPRRTGTVTFETIDMPVSEWTIEPATPRPFIPLPLFDDDDHEEDEPPYDPCDDEDDYDDDERYPF